MRNLEFFSIIHINGKQSYYHIRKLSDELCKEHNLSVIIPGAQRGRKYKEWQSEQNGSAWKTQIRKDINFCIKSTSTYEEFLLLMRAKGYEIKGETFEEGAAKYISFRPLDKERFVRGSTRSLGKEYTKERIKERMKQKSELTSTYKKCEKEVQSLNRKLENLNQYLGQTQPDPVQAQQTKNRNHSL